MNDVVTATTRRAMAGDFSCSSPFADAAGLAATWITRGSNFVVAVSDVQAGAVFERSSHPDEAMAYLVDLEAAFTAGNERIEARADTLVIVPPGPQRIEALSVGRLVRIYASAGAPDLAAQAHNAAAYADAISDTAPLSPWPSPPAGFRLRSYPLSEYPTTPENLQRIFRCTNLMVNFLAPRLEPRDIRRLPPHSHSDFEQASLALEGRYLHHVRYPWTADGSQWLDDEALEVGSPSVTVIPPGVIHTSRNLDAPARLIDIFAPPRLDFSRRAGAVRNEADYPLLPTASTPE